MADRAARFLGLEDDPAERVAARIASIDRVHESLRTHDDESLSALARARFWVTLVGPSAASWPVADLPDEQTMVARANSETGSAFDAIARAVAEALGLRHVETQG